MGAYLVTTPTIYTIQLFLSMQNMKFDGFNQLNVELTG